jgi:hypothetical protein
LFHQNQARVAYVRFWPFSAGRLFKLYYQSRMQAVVSSNANVRLDDHVEFVDEDIDYAHRIGIADVVVEAFGK